MDKYSIVAGKKEADFDVFLQNYSKNVQGAFLTRLHTYPFANRQVANKLGAKGKVEKKKRFYQYYIDGGDRVIYDILKEKKIVSIHFFGNHKDAGVFLKKYDK